MTTRDELGLPWEWRTYTSDNGGEYLNLESVNAGPFHNIILDGEIGCFIGDAEAAFIVTAANSHHDLVEALERMVAMFGPDNHHLYDDERAALHKARAAIAKARGEG